MSWSQPHKKLGRAGVLTGAVLCAWQQAEEGTVRRETRSMMTESLQCELGNWIPVQLQE